MDTDHDNSNITDSVQRPMDTDDVDNKPSEHAHLTAATAPATTPSLHSDTTHTHEDDAVAADDDDDDDSEDDHQERQMTRYQAPASSPSGSLQSNPSVHGASTSGSRRSSFSTSSHDRSQSQGDRGPSGGRGRGSPKLITQPPVSIVKSPWKDNQADVAYDDMAVETFESGKGADEDNEWQDDEPRASGSLATVIDDGGGSMNTIQSTSSLRSTANSTTQPPSDPPPWSPESSQPLPWSPDPKPSQATSPNRDTAIHSPPKLARVPNPATPSAEPLMGLARIQASRERLIKQVVEGLNRDKAVKAAQVAQASTPERQATSRSAPSSPTTPKHPVARATIEQWHTIMDGSASKRKAKASPKANVSSSIRKPEAARSVKKQLFEPASQSEGTPASKN